MLKAPPNPEGGAAPSLNKAPPIRAALRSRRACPGRSRGTESGAGLAARDCDVIKPTPTAFKPPGSRWRRTFGRLTPVSGARVMGTGVISRPAVWDTRRCAFVRPRVLAAPAGGPVTCEVARPERPSLAAPRKRLSLLASLPRKWFSPCLPHSGGGPGGREGGVHVPGRGQSASGRVRRLGLVFT